MWCSQDLQDAASPLLCMFWQRRWALTCVNGNHQFPHFGASIATIRCAHAHD